MNFKINYHNNFYNYNKIKIYNDENNENQSPINLKKTDTNLVLESNKKTTKNILSNHNSVNKTSNLKNNSFKINTNFNEQKNKEYCNTDNENKKNKHSLLFNNLIKKQELKIHDNREKENKNPLLTDSKQTNIANNLIIEETKNNIKNILFDSNSTSESIPSKDISTNIENKIDVKTSIEEIPQAIFKKPRHIDHRYNKYLKTLKFLFKESPKKILLNHNIVKDPYDSKYDIFKQTILTPEGKKITVERYAAELDLIANSLFPQKLKARSTRPRKIDQLNWRKLLSETLQIDPYKKNIVYRIVNLNKLNKNGINKFYIGKTKNEIIRRAITHIRMALRNKGCPNLKTPIRKYGIRSFKFFVEHEGNISKVEHKLIREYNATNSEIGYNIAD